MLTIEGELSSQLLEIIETQDFVENKNFLEKYQKELWKFWKEKISSTILIKNELTNLEPLAINNFKFDVDDYKEFLLEVENVVNEAKESTTINKLISKYGTNTLGPTSVLNISDKSLSIFSQNRAVYSSGGFDFTGLILFDFKSTEWESEISFSF